MIRAVSVVALAGTCLVGMAQTKSVIAPGKPEVKQISDNKVTLQWKSTETVYGIFDDFEGHKDFALNSPGEVGWKYVDMDRAKTYVIGSYVYENAGLPMAFQVWNPSKTSPAYEAKKGLPNSGEKCLISMANQGKARNDWMISPDLSKFNFDRDITLSFWARAISSSYGKEEIKIGYSTTTSDVSSFTFLNGGERIEIPESDRSHPEMWYFTFGIPSDARYVAINCVSEEGQALLIDDIAIVCNKVLPNKAETRNYLEGFNIYRDGNKINTTLLTEHMFTDEAPTYGKHTYQLEAVYQDGEKVKGESLEVDLINIHLLPFIETFYTYSFETNFWEVTTDSTGKAYWEPGYRDGGEIDNAAVFKPSLRWKKGYSDQCLTSMELDATGLNEVMLSYDIALEAYMLTLPAGQERTIESLFVEVSVEGGAWQRVREHNNANGSFGYDRVYVDLTSKVANKKFRIRFNASGQDPWNISAWYIAYVKAYEKKKANVSGKVTCAGTAVAGAQIVITSQDKDVYKATSEADGTYTISDVDAGKYSLQCKREGYNPFTMDTAIAQGARTIDVAMTQPIVRLASNAQTHTMAAEAQVENSIALNNTGNGKGRMSLWVDHDIKRVNAAPALEAIKTFNTSDLMQASIGFDGEFFYLARNDEYGSDALIHKYDKQNKYLGSFMPNLHVRRYFAMAFDGENFFTANGDSIIRIFNMRDGVQLGEIPTRISDINHIAYDEARDAFWVGALNSLALVSRSGQTLMEEKIYPDSLVLFSGSAYDPYFKDGPCLWIMDRSRPNHPLNAFTTAVIRRIDLTSMELKDDYAYPCDKLPGFKYGGADASAGLVWGEGLCGSTRYKDGHFVLMGVILANPGLVGIIDLYEVDEWLKVSDYSVNLAAGENKQVKYTVDASKMRLNDTRKATIKFRLDPYAAPQTFEVTASINAKAQYAKPLALTADLENDRTAKLSWTAPDGTSAPTGYDIYRNGVKVNASAVTALAYTDQNLKAGAQVYTVKALYGGDKESAFSNEAKVNVLVGVACYAPFDLTATNVRNTSIALSWKDPSEVGMLPVNLRWDRGNIADGIGAFSDFVAAAAWSVQDLETYRDMTIESVSFVPQAVNATYAIVIYENDEVVKRQSVETSEITIGALSKVKLSTPHKINDRKNLKVGVAVHYKDLENIELAIGVDAGPAVKGKGNLLYLAGYGWCTIGQIGVSDANINLALELAPKTGDREPFAKGGYNVYRNGTKINQSPLTECKYSDPMTTAGTYTYTVTAIHEIGESYPCAPARATIVDISAHDAPQDLTASVTMNRSVNLHWNYAGSNVAKGSKSAFKPFSYLRHFDTKFDVESAVVTDGRNIYTAHRNRKGQFHKYDIDGNFIETFEIEGAQAITDLTYDGTYFYGASNTTVLYCFDFETRKVVKETTIVSVDAIRHLTYIPDLDEGKGGFELGNWTTSVFVNMDGTFIGEGYTGLDGAYGAAYHDGKLYYSQQGSAGLCELMEVDFATLTATGNSVDFSKSRVLDLEENSRSGGLCTYMAPNGTVTLILAIQQPAPSISKLLFAEAAQNAYVKGFNVYRDNQKVNTALVSVRDYTEELSTPGTYNYTVTAVYVDEVESAKSASVAVKIVEAGHCEAPVALKAEARKRDVSLQWNTVLEQGWKGDDMESYDNLSTGTVGKWKTIDGDGMAVYMSEDFAFQGIDQAKTFFVFDETTLGPTTSGYAYSGHKAMLAMAAWDEEAIAKTSDWLIAEAKTTNGGAAARWISFVARGLEAGRKEQFSMEYSTTSDDTVSFMTLTGKAERVGHLWTRYTYKLPQDIKYVAIHYTSVEGRALFIDDVYMGDAACPFLTDEEQSSGNEFVEAVVGYSVYRDGVLLNTEPIKNSAYFDGFLANGEYTYQVEALYNTSCKSPKSEPIKVKVEYAAPYNEPQNLTASLNEQNDVNLKWDAPAYDEPRELGYVKSVEIGGAIGYTSASTYYVAVKWEPSDLMGVFGYSLSAVAAVFYEAPVECILMIWQGGKAVYQQEVTRECLSGGELSTFSLDEAYKIDYTQDLMVGFRIASDAGSLSIVYNGDVPDNGYSNLYSDDGKNWFPAYTYTSGQWKGNWFMMFGLDITYPAVGTDLQGYRVYRDNAVIQNLTPTTMYVDAKRPQGTYKYRVAAVYGKGGEKTSKTITVGVGNEDREEALFSMWPNPAQGKVWISGEYTKLEVLDMQGKLRLSKAGGRDGELDIRSLATGIYFVRVENARGVQVRKLVVK